MDYATVKSRLRKSYDKHWHDRAGMDDPAWRVKERDAFAELLESDSGGPARVLEIGAGHGASSEQFAARGLDVLATDLSPNLVAECRRRGLAAEVADFSDLPYGDGSFDGVFSMNCLLHVPKAEIDGVLGEVSRVLRPGGVFYWGQYGGKDHEGPLPEDRYDPPRFFALYTSDSLRRTAERRFTVLDLHETVAPSTGGHPYYGALLRDPVSAPGSSPA
ncbi:class I SAM-dependent methyltransferase [Salininema proteolyticum]|uniref:Class I SAM-dependent methyltransferase n=1 Tax=Salininema proteolyticum TaxID=1607685 RepID=A0ABV8TVF2_9ACTN